MTETTPTSPQSPQSAPHSLREGDVGIIERVYYIVPQGYGDGPEFPGTLAGLREAVAHARASIRAIDHLLPDQEPRFTRAWVEKRFTIRWLPESGEIASGVDMPVDRVEIFRLFED